MSKKYIGVEPVKEKERKPKTRFRTNKHNSKVDNFIRESKGEYKIIKHVLIILCILALVWVFKPFDFLIQKLEEKRIAYNSQYYNGIDTKIDINVDLSNLSKAKRKGVMDTVFYISNYDYYKKLPGSIILPLQNGQVVTAYNYSHRAIDILGYNGQNVVAAANGTVNKIGYDDRYGNYVMIKHFIENHELYTYYGNLGSINVVEGQNVSSGQLIGTITTSVEALKNVSGQTSHLHFCVRRNTSDLSGMDPLLLI